MNRHARRTAAPAPPQHGKREGSRRGKTVAIAATAAVAGGVPAAYSVAASWESLRQLAHKHGLLLWQDYPIGLDGGLIGVSLLCIVLTWAGHPIWWLRMFVRAFGAGTIAANLAAGYPDPAGMLLRGVAPAMLILVVEIVLAVLLDQIDDERDPIPLARWVFAFPSTFMMWRRMNLWGIKKYTEAVRMEMSRLKAMVRLEQHYGKKWKREAPTDVVWMLVRGVHMSEALARVAVLTGEGKTGTGRAGTGGGTGAGAGRGGTAGTGKGAGGGTGRAGTGSGAPGGGTGRAGGKQAATAGPSGGTLPPPPPGNGDGTADLTAELLIYAELDKDPSLTGRQLAALVGCQDSYARRIKRQWRSRPASPETFAAANPAAAAPPQAPAEQGEQPGER